MRYRSSILLNFKREGTLEAFLWSRRVEVLSLCYRTSYFHPFLVFLSIFFFFFFCPLITWINLYLSLLFFGKSIWESKTRLVFTQLKTPISVLSKRRISLAFVGKAIKHLLLSLWAQPLKQLAQLHFLGLNLKRPWKRVDLCSNISSKITVS